MFKKMIKEDMPTEKNDFMKPFSLFFKKVCLVLFLIIFCIFISKLFCNAQQDMSLEEKILDKLEALVEGQTDIQDALNKILSNQEDIKKELDVIKIRIMVH